MTTTTPTPALADLDLDKLQQQASMFSDIVAFHAGHVRTLKIFASSTLDLIALARRAAQPVAPMQLADEHRAAIEEAAQVLESAAAHNRAKGRTVLERTQQDRADRLRLVLATPSPQIAEVAELPPLPKLYEGRYSIPELEVMLQGYARDAIAASRRAAGGEVIAWAAESNIGGGVRVLTKFTAAEADIDRYVNAEQARIAGCDRVKVPLCRATPAPASAGQADAAIPTPVDEDAAFERWAIGSGDEEICKPRTVGGRDAGWVFSDRARTAWKAGRAAQPAEDAGQAGLTLETAPLGTKAMAHGGGHWIRAADGWKWCTGSTFPRPGGDWTGELVAPTERAAAPAELARDAERLDWLDSVNRDTNDHYGTKYGWKFDINHNRAALMDHNWPPLTVREAIDAAMKDRATHQPSAQKGGA